MKYNISVTKAELLEFSKRGIRVRECRVVEGRVFFGSLITLWTVEDEHGSLAWNGQPTPNAILTACK